jgi:predicted NBD/HSP70 family sugar kinase
MGGEIGYYLTEEEAAQLIQNNAFTAGNDYGFLEKRVSGSALDRMGAKLGLDSRGLFREYDTNADARGIIDRFLFSLSAALANCVTLLNPSLTVLGGGVSRDIARFKDRICDFLTRFTPVSTRLIFTQMGNDAGAIGALERGKQLLNQRIC